jgi:hypothetical protein
MRRVVSNTGPLLHLSEASDLDLLSLMGEVHIPRGVEREIAYHTSTWITPAWITVDAHCALGGCCWSSESRRSRGGTGAVGAFFAVDVGQGTG